MYLFHFSSVAISSRSPNFSPILHSISFPNSCFLFISYLFCDFIRLFIYLPITNFLYSILFFLFFKFICLPTFRPFFWAIYLLFVNFFSSFFLFTNLYNVPSLYQFIHFNNQFRFPLFPFSFFLFVLLFLFFSAFLMLLSMLSFRALHGCHPGPQNQLLSSVKITISHAFSIVSSDRISSVTNFLP
jgi:hypothetical protein